MNQKASPSTAPVGSESMDVGEILSAIWLRKKWVLMSMMLGLALSILYVRSATPLYTSEAIVALTKEQTKIPGGKVSDLIGIENSDPSKRMIDRVMARDFIMQVADDLNLRNDHYYNTQPSPHTGFRNVLKILRDRILGPKAVETDDDRTTRAYRKSVSLSMSRGNSIIIETTHPNPDKAAQVANRISTLILDSIKDDARRSYLGQQEYLVELMTKAQDDINNSQRALSRLKSKREDDFSRFPLQRDARIAETVYNTLVEKVQTQMAVMGYEGEVGSIFQTATPSTRPSHPNIPFALGGGMMGGAVIGIIVVLVSALSSGIIFNRSSISNAVSARTNIYPHNFITRSVSTSRALYYANRIHAPWLAELLWSVKSGKSRLVLVIPTAPGISSMQASLLIGRLLANSEHRTAVILLDKNASKNISAVDATSSTFTREIVEIQRFGDLHIFSASQETKVEEILISSKINDAIRSPEISGYSHIVIGTTDDTGAAAAIALNSADPSTVIITKAGETTSRKIAKLKSIIGLDINISI